MFPQRLDSPLAYAIAKAMMDGFNRHYRLFRTESARAKHRFETADWLGQQRAQRERIEFYDLRVKEQCGGWRRSLAQAASPWRCGTRPSSTTSGCSSTTTSLNWPRPFSTRSPARSCTARISTTISSFVRPAVSTEYIENDEPAAKPTFRPITPRAKRCTRR